MATIEDVLTALAQLGTELRGEIGRQGQELRDHIDHTAAMLKADLRSEMRERFDALLPDITSLDVMTRRLENAEWLFPGSGVLSGRKDGRGGKMPGW